MMGTRTGFLRMQTIYRNRLIRDTHTLREDVVRHFVQGDDRSSNGDPVNGDEHPKYLPTGSISLRVGTPRINVPRQNPVMRLRFAPRGGVERQTDDFDRILNLDLIWRGILLTDS